MGLRARRRRAQDSAAFLLTYSQTAEYAAGDDVSLAEVLQNPFQSSAKRSEYVAYLKEADPALFGDVTAVSAVFLPEFLEPTGVATIGSKPMYSKNFYCQNSGEACSS